MTITFGSKSATPYRDSLATANPSLPASTVAGNALIAFISTESAGNLPSGISLTPTDPTWTLLSTNGNDVSGPLVWVYAKTAVGSDDCTFSIPDAPASGVQFDAIVYRFTKTLQAWDFAAATQSSGDLTVGASSYSLTPAADPGVTSGDLIAWACQAFSNTGTFGTVTASQSGVVFGTKTNRNAGSGSIASTLDTFPITSGTSAGAPTVAGSSPGTTCEWVTGSFIRLREFAITSFDPLGMLGLCGM